METFCFFCIHSREFTKKSSVSEFRWEISSKLHLSYSSAMLRNEKKVFLLSSGQQEPLDVVSVDWMICIIYIATESPALSPRLPPSFRYLCQPESVTTLPTASGSDETGIQWKFNSEAMSYSSCGIKYLYINKYGSLDRQHHFISAVAITCSRIAIFFLEYFFPALKSA